MTINRVFTTDGRILVRETPDKPKCVTRKPIVHTVGSDDFEPDDLPPATVRAYGLEPPLVSLDPRPESGSVAGFLVIALCSFAVGVLSGLGMR